jgi:hypothetical protein
LSRWSLICPNQHPPIGIEIEAGYNFLGDGMSQRMETPENWTRDAISAEEARRQEALVALYSGLTGADESQARSVSAHLASIQDWENGLLDPLSPSRHLSSPWKPAGILVPARPDQQLTPNAMSARSQTSSGRASAEMLISNPQPS